MQGASKVKEQKVKAEKLVLCYPRALGMPLYKECKKYFISSSSIIISHFQSPPPPPLKPPSFPRGGHDNAKRAQVECNNFFEAVAIGRGGVSDSYPAFFLPIATTSNKNFKSAETVNEKFRCL